MQSANACSFGSSQKSRAASPTAPPSLSNTATVLAGTSSRGKARAAGTVR